MSCVISVCYSDYCTIMGDGRFLNLNDDPPRVESEFFEKVIKLNSYVCMGFTGDPIPVLDTYFDLKSSITEDMRLEDILNRFVDCVVERNYKQRNIQMIFSGKASSGKYETYQVQITKDNEINKKHYKPDHSIAVVYSPPIGPDVSSIINENLNKKLHEITDIRKIQYLMGACITKIAETNPTVNRVLFFVEASDKIYDDCKTFRFISED